MKQKKQTNNAIYSIPRRSFLKGLGASTLFFSPIVGNMRLNAQSSIAKRLLLLQTKTGFYTDGGNFGVNNPTHGATISGLGSSLSPLEPFKNQMIFLDGIKMDTVHPNFASKPDKHQTGKMCIWTGTKFLQAGSAFGPSLDTYLGQTQNQQTIVKNIQAKIGGTNNGGMFGGANIENFALYFDMNGNAIAPPYLPSQVFEELFDVLLAGGSTGSGGAGSSGGSIEPSPNDIARYNTRKSILNLITNDLSRLNNQISVSEKIKIESHLDAISDLEKKLENQMNPVEIPSVDLAVCKDPKNYIPTQSAQGAATNHGVASRLNIEVIVQGMSCGLTNIGATTISSPSPGEMTGQQPSSQHHTHGLGSELEIYDRWSAETVAYALNLMDSVILADGKSLLYHSVVVWGSEVKEQNHIQDDMKFMIFGSGGGALNTGKYFNFSNSRSNADMLLTLAQVMGSNATSFGDSTTTLNELFSNG